MKIISGLMLGSLLSISAAPLQAYNNVTETSQLPDGSFPALYYWSPNTTIGFGAYSSTYRFGSHPGYNRRTNYFADLDREQGFLVEHPSALLAIFAESEKAAIANSEPGWEIRALYRTTPFEVRVYGDGFPARWDADIWYRSDSTVRRVEGYGWWNFSWYSGRACPDEHDIWALSPPGLGTVEEWFCAPMVGKPDPELNLGGLGCGLRDGAPNIGSGNPVHLASGNKFQRVRLIRTTGNSPIELELFYNSQTAQAVPRDKWSHTYKRALSNVLEVALDNAAEVSGVIQAKYLSIRARRPDGKVLRYSNVLDWATRTTINSEWSKSAAVPDQLFSVTDPATGEVVALELRSSEGEVEHYALDGRLVSITTRSGLGLHLTYASGGNLAQVSDDLGHSIQFGYAGSALTSVTAPDGSLYGLSYDAAGNMAQISFPDETPGDSADNPRRVFLYENSGFPSHLTGIIDERGNRAARWDYDTSGRSISSEHANGSDKHSLTFNADGSTSVMDPLAHVRTYRFSTNNGRIAVSATAGGMCNDCGRDAASYSYDAHGFLAQKVDHKGIATRYVRDEAGRASSRTEAVGTPEAYTVTTEWHPTWRKPVAITKPGAISIFRYSPEGFLLSQTVRDGAL